MKILKSLFVLFIAISLSSCSSETSAPTYPLSLANIAGTYNIQSLSVSTDINTTTSNGLSIKVATASLVGDIFQIDLVMNTDGTYTAKGAYTTTYRLSPVAGPGVEEVKIVNIDYSGNFALNTVDNRITFSGGLLQDLSGTLEFQTFNETSFSLFQEIDLNVGSNVETAKTAVSFIRK